MLSVALLVAQLAAMAAGLALGGAATKAGGMLLLASLWCFGANVGRAVAKEVA